MKKLSTLALFLAIIFNFGYSQEIIEVQAFNYYSETRDTFVDFLTTPNNNYERILMVYSMRCKDGLVSDGADRNRGCGEWDYSCNTYIHDPSRKDSSRAVHPSYLISSFDGDVFNYTSQPTYTYYQNDQKEVTINSTTSESISSIGNGNTIVDLSNEVETKIQFIFRDAELSSAGVTAGEINGLELELDASIANLKDLRIRLKNTAEPQFDPNLAETGTFKQVYFKDTDFNGSGLHRFNFYDTFIWDGNNLIIEISFNNESQETVSFKADQLTSVSSLLSNERDYNVEFTGAENLQLNGPVEEISTEITISFWQYGGDELPINSTILEAKDNDNIRQVNVHLPWGNSTVYWDCGNDGSGYDRIEKKANLAADFRGRWNHWAFTKNATTGQMKMYLNGNLWQSGTGKFKTIDLQAMNIGSAILSDRVYYGKMDEFRLWSSELDQATIKAWMSKKLDNSHPNYSDLKVYYTFDEGQSNQAVDSSPSGNHANINGDLQFRKFAPQDIFKNMTSPGQRPKTGIVQGEYKLNITTIVTRDSLINAANKVEEFTVTGTDLIEVGTEFLYEAGSMPVINENGIEVDYVEVPAEGTLTITELEYFRKTDAKYEIMSFVTPYGIFLDLGIEGKSWVFDVTDFGPILNGNKRITMERGGQWQEDIDIKFLYVEGTPSRDVIDINQIWPVSSESYTRILSEEKFEPRDFRAHPDATMYKMRAMITGHGQEGEFIGRDHYLNINGGNRELVWEAWKECAGNPVHPQGGTWVYDRAGWCPGMATDLIELDVSSHLTPGEISEVDYGMAETASGDSRYIVNVQMVSYGDPNFDLDAGIVDILQPTEKVEYEKFNPLCTHPKIVIVNNGSVRLTSVDIHYGVEGGLESEYTWSGNLDYLQSVEIDLPNMPLVNMYSDGTFYAKVSNPNGEADQYANNNEMTSPFEVVKMLPKDVVITMQTNNAYWETKYFVEDSDGNIIFERGDDLVANKIYRDSLKNLSGCYKLRIIDTGEDGIAWWANNDGNGYIQIKGVGLASTLLEPDFGSFLIYEFFAGDPLTSIEDPLESDHLVNIYPNPSDGIFNIEISGFSGEIKLQLYNQMGQLISTESMGSIGERFSHKLDLNNELDGIYFLYITDESIRIVNKLIKD